MAPHPKLLDHFTNPRNSGSLPCPPAIRVQMENPACGDILVLYVVSDEDGLIQQVRYQVRGCTAAIAAGSALTGLLLGRSQRDCRTLQAADVEGELGELQPASKHVAVLCIDTVTQLLRSTNR